VCSSDLVEDYRVVIAQPILDFGDAPAGYPTLLAEDGARHVLTTGFFLGSTIDPEEDGQPSPAATGDGADEDGITFPAEILTGEDVALTVTASAAGLVDAWIDFNSDGDWDDAGEQVLASEPVVTGINMVNVPIAPAARSGLTYARFRFSSAGGLTPTGQAPDGEVEDYEISIVASSWHNVEFPTDVNGINGPTPLDALLIINELTDRMFSDPVTGVLILPPAPPPFFDVDDNGVVSPLDALMVISDIPTTPPQAPLAARQELVAPVAPLTPSTLDVGQANRAKTRDARRAVEMSNRRAIEEPALANDQLHDVALRSVKRFLSRSDRAVVKLSETTSGEEAENTLDDVFSAWK
jgi:hypothetical protein